MRQRAGDGTASGFTLIEMLVILAILALLGGIAFPSIDKAMRRQAFATSATQLELTLRSARAEAIRHDKAVRLDVSPDRHGFGYAGVIEQLPDSTTVSMPNGGIAFFADGSASGGKIALADRRATRNWIVRGSTGAIERVR